MVAQLDSTFLRIAPGRVGSRLVGYSFFEGRPATTKGRWWNPVVFANLRHAAGKPGLVGSRVDRPIFIVGMGRSGTTLLGRILAAHPDVGFLNEPKALWHVIRADEDIIGSYAESHAGRLRLGPGDAGPDVCERAHALFTWYLRASRSRRLVDKYPELIFRHAFVRALFPDARFLIATRSPWSTLESVARWSDSHAVEDADWWGVEDQKWDILWKQGVEQSRANADLRTLELAGETDQRVRAAVEWIVSMREATSLAAIDRYAQLVSYEKLTRSPRQAVREILSFCELPASPRTEAYADAIVSGQGIGGGRGDLSAPLPDFLAGAMAATWSELKPVAC